MRDLELAGIASIDPTRPRREGRGQLPLSRAAFVTSVAAHVIAGYALSRHALPSVSSPATPLEAFFLLDLPASRASDAATAVPPAESGPEAFEILEPAPPPLPRAAEVVPQPPPRAAEAAPQPRVVVEPPPAVVEPSPAVEPSPLTEPAPLPATEPAAGPTPRAYIDFDEERRRAANQVIGSREAEQEYLTFSIDDVAPPRPEAEPDAPSIFDGTGGPRRGPTVGQVGQARTKLGHRVSALCNALTGGFSVLRFGSFCAGPPDGEPSGLFPEARPAYLDLMPECEDTRDTAPALALEAPFSTVKCRLVKREEPPDELP